MNQVIAVELKLTGLGAYEGQLKSAAGTTRDFGQSVDGIGTHVSKAQHVFSAFGGSAQQMGQKLETTGKSMTIGITAPLTIMGAKAIATASDFEKSMNTMGAVAGVPGPQLEKLRDLSIQLGRDTVFSANEAAQAQLELGKAGISVADIMGGALKNTLDLATAGDLDLANAATIAANAMNTFGLSGKQSQEAVDALAGAANASSADVSDLAQALAQGGLAAKAAGFSIQDTTAYLAAFADKGLRGSDAGTSLKTMLLNLVPVTDKAKAAMKEYGISFTDSNGKMKSATEIAGILQTQLGHLSDAEQQTALKVMFGTDAYRAALIAMELGADGIQKYKDSTMEAGTAAEVAAAKMEGLPGVIERFKGSMETALLMAGDRLAPTFSLVADAVGTAVDAFSSLPAPVQAVAVHLAAAAAAAGPALLITGKLMQLWGSGAQTLNTLVLAYMRYTAGVSAATAATQAFSVALKGVAFVAALNHIVGGAMRSKEAFEDAEKAAREHGKSIIALKGDPEGAVVSINRRIREHEAEIRKLQESYSGFGRLKGLLPWEDAGAGAEKILEHRSAIEGYRGALDSMSSTTQNVHTKTLDLLPALERHGIASNALTGAAKSLTGATGELGAAQERGIVVTETMTEEQLKAAAASKAAGDAQTVAAQQTFQGLQLQEEALAEFSKAVGESYNSATSLVQKFGSESEVTSQQVMQHFKDQIAAAREWSANLIALAKAGIDQGLIMELAQAGPKAAPLVKALLDAVKSGNTQAINEAQQALRTILGDTIAQINGQAPAAGAAGANLGGSAKSAIVNALNQAKTDTGNITNAIVNDLNRVGNTHPRPTVRVEDLATGTINVVQSRIDGMRGKTVYVTIQEVFKGHNPYGRHTGGQVFHKGGEIPKFHSGGAPAHNERDIRAQVGEWVIRRDSVQEWERMWGGGIMAAINRGPQATPWANARPASGGSTGSAEQMAALASALKGGGGGTVINGDVIVNVKAIPDLSKRDLGSRRLIREIRDGLREEETAGK